MVINEDLLKASADVILASVNDARRELKKKDFSSLIESLDAIDTEARTWIDKQCTMYCNKEV